MLLENTAEKPFYNAGFRTGTFIEGAALLEMIRTKQVVPIYSEYTGEDKNGKHCNGALIKKEEVCDMIEDSDVFAIMINPNTLNTEFEFFGTKCKGGGWDLPTCRLTIHTYQKPEF